MAGFYSNNDAKMRQYKRNLLLEDKNIQHQADKLEEYNLAQQGIEVQEKGLEKFATAIGSAITGTSDAKEVKPVDKTKALEQAVQGDIYGNVIPVKEGKKPKNKGLVKSPPALTVENPEIKLARDFNANYESLFGAENRKMENAAMNAEEQLTKLANAITAASTKREVSGMAAEDAISVFRELSDKEDQKIRQKFMKVLDQMASKATAKKDMEMINRIQDLIERQRMADAFEKFSANAISDEFARKIQRNLLTALENKKVARNKESYQMGQEDILSKQIEVENKAASTIQQRMAELRARKKAKSLSSPTNTSVMTDMPTNFDMRAFNKGATKRDTNKELEGFVDLLQEFDNSTGIARSKRRDQIKNIIARQRKINPQTADRMKDLYSAFVKQK